MELELKSLTKKYREKIAVDHVSAVFRPGTYGLLGANGAGKTTLMRMICDVLSPSSGEITVNGNRISVMGENYRALLGYLPQNFGYYPDYTAREFMHYIAALKGIPKTAAKNQTRQLLELVSLTSVSDRKIKTFSGGMKQRVAIAMSMAQSPRLLLADEPTSALDVTVQAQVIQELKKIRENFKTAIILVTHNMGVASYISDKIAVMKDGELIEFGNKEQIINNPQKEYTKSLLNAVINLK